MAMNAATLAAAIVTQWKAQPGIGFSSPLSAAQETLLLANALGIATAVIAHIQSQAVVSASGADPQGGVVTSTGTIS